MKFAIIKEIAIGAVLSLLVYFQYQIKDNTKEQIKSFKTGSKTLDSLYVLNQVYKLELLKQDSLVLKLQNRLIDLSDNTIDSLTDEEFNDLRDRANSEL